MRSVGTLQYGGPDLLRVLTEERPAPDDRRVLIAVELGTVNPADLQLRSGGVGPHISGGPPYIGGLECSGRVLSAPEGSGLTPGQRVAAITTFIPHARGCHSEVVALPPDSVTAIPEQLPSEHAAVVPMSGLTALLAVDRAGARAGRTVAVTGAGGAVGAFAVELAAERGARVIGICARRHVARVLSLGAAHAVERGPEAVKQALSTAGGPVDAVIDAALLGSELRDLIRPGGRLCALRAVDDIERPDVAVETVSVRTYQGDRDRLAALIERAVDGRITPQVEEIYSLEHAAAAHRRLEAGGLNGRLLLDFHS